MVVPNFMVPEEAFQIENNGKTAITNYICRLLMACKTVWLNMNSDPHLLSLLRDVGPIGPVDQENMFNLIMSEKHNTFDYPDVPLDSKFIIQEEQNSYQQEMISIRLNISYEYIDLKLRLSISNTIYGMEYKCYTLYRNYNIQLPSALRDHPMWFLKNVSSWFYKIHFIYPFFQQFHMHVEEEKIVRERIGEISLLEEMKREILSFVPDRKWNIMMLFGKYFNIFIMEGDLSVIKKDKCYATHFIHLMMDLSNPEITISRFVKPFNSDFIVYENIVESIEEIVEDKILQLEKVSSTDPNLILLTMKSWMISHSFKGKYMEEEEESREGILRELIN